MTDITDMSIGSIEAYLKEKKEREEKEEKIEFEGNLYLFRVDKKGNIHLIDTNTNKRIAFISYSLPALIKAVELAEKRQFRKLSSICVSIDRSSKEFRKLQKRFNT